MKTKLWTIFLMVLALTSGQSMAENGKISITAGYRERIALPSDAVLEVELLDVSRADAPSIRLSSQLFRMDRVPLSVDLHYDPSIIDDRMTYSVAASLLSKGRVIFRTTSAYPVITREAPTRVDVVLQMMPQENYEPVSDQRIAGVPWALSELGGRAFVGDDNPTIVFDTDGTFSLFGGCNRFRGKADLGEGRLTFPQQFAGTKMVCPDPRMRLERDVLEALAATIRFHRNGRSLAFANESGLTTARFEERPD
ncbi:YbaY family lipoprotein [Sedimentitalea sp. XS_ASV28]|uniref:YbaY family lipoprotein n=1 Tax=Sedimentitalea sp. XS_ASV28 TaxID=3241296 RepID=UPI003511DBB4